MKMVTLQQRHTLHIPTFPPSQPGPVRLLTPLCVCAHFRSQLKHALAGVEKGRKAGTAPVEIMGLMIGKAEGSSIVVLDACPLPVEGSETRVVADDAQVHMLQLMDSMELRRKEGFVGWYHRCTASLIATSAAVNTLRAHLTCLLRC